MDTGLDIQPANGGTKKLQEPRVHQQKGGEPVISSNNQAPNWRFFSFAAWPSSIPRRIRQRLHKKLGLMVSGRRQKAPLGVRKIFLGVPNHPKLEHFRIETTDSDCFWGRDAPF